MAVFDPRAQPSYASKNSRNLELLKQGKKIYFNETIHYCSLSFREAAKKEKLFFLVDCPLRGGKGVRSCPLRKKLFFYNLYSICCPLSRGHEVGGLKDIVDCPLVKNFFVFTVSLYKERHKKNIRPVH